MNESVLLDYIISNSNGDTLLFEENTSLELLKEAILRGFQVRSHTRFDRYYLPRLNKYCYREETIPGCGFSWRTEGYSEGEGDGRGSYRSYEDYLYSPGSGGSPGQSNCILEKESSWDEDFRFFPRASLPTSLQGLYE